MLTLHVDAYLSKGVSSRQPEVHPGLQTITAGHTTTPQAGLNGLKEEDQS